MKLEGDLRKVHYLWRGKWSNGARQMRFWNEIDEVTNEKPDDEEREEADGEHHFDVDIVK